MKLENYNNKMITSILNRFDEQGIEARAASSKAFLWLISFAIDTVTLIVYFSFPFLFDDDSLDFSLYTSSLLLVLLAGFRAISALPVVKCLQSYESSTIYAVFYIWLLANFSLGIFKMILLIQNHNNDLTLWLVVCGTLLSTLVQVMYIYFYIRQFNFNINTLQLDKRDS